MRKLKDRICSLVLPVSLTLASIMASVQVAARPSYAAAVDTESLCRSHTEETLLTLDYLREKRAGSSDLSASGKKYMPSAVSRTECVTIPLLVLVVGFNGASEHFPEGAAYNPEYNWGDTVFVSEDSLTRYYLEMSGGQFTFSPVQEQSAYGEKGNTNLYDRENDGVVHVNVDHAHGPWADDTAAANRSLADAFADAVTAAGESVDFAAYDTDGNGEITTDELALCIIAAGYEGSFSGTVAAGDDRYLWAHAFSFRGESRSYGWTGDLPQPDGLTVNSFICMGETLLSGVVERQGILGVLAHELGHYIGLADLYETVAGAMEKEWSEYTVGYLSLMDQGGWGRTPEGDYRLFSIDVWSRILLGWIDPVEVTEPGTYDISDADSAWEAPASGTLDADSIGAGSSSSGKTVLRVPSGNAKEYYLIENHSLTGRDAGMKKMFGYVGNKDASDDFDIDSGIVIWHIDEGIIEKYRALNRINHGGHRPGVMEFFPEQEECGTWTTHCQEDGGYVDRRPFLTPEVLSGAFPDLADGFLLPRYDPEEPDVKKSRLDSCTWIRITEPEDRSKINEGESVLRVEIDPVHHVPQENAVRERYTLPTVQAEGGYDEVYYCTRCGAEVSRIHKVIPKLPTGWVQQDGKWYYYDRIGDLTTGWLTLGSKTYFLDENGIMQTGWKKIGGIWYFFKPSGAMQTGWKKIGGIWYFFKPSGAMQTGWKKIGGVWYFFESSGAMVTGNRRIGSKTYRFSSSGACLNP